MPYQCTHPGCNKPAVVEVADFREVSPAACGDIIVAPAGSPGAAAGLSGQTVLRRRRTAHRINFFCAAHNRPSKTLTAEELAEEAEEADKRAQKTAAEPMAPDPGKRKGKGKKEGST